MPTEPKIYQVFVSSTYTDLEHERSKVLRDMVMNNFYPLGMENFPASNAEQLSFCKQMIDRADYYILIIGTRYGTELNDGCGLSYTELEYDYAESIGIPILVFISNDPDEKPLKYLEDEQKRAKYESFRRRASSKKWCLNGKLPKIYLFL